MAVGAESLEVQGEGGPPRVGLQEPVQDSPAGDTGLSAAAGPGPRRGGDERRPLPVPAGVPKAFGEGVPVDLQLRDLRGKENERSHLLGCWGGVRTRALNPWGRPRVPAGSGRLSRW